ncbi:MAG: adenylate/guanylate cyclase domain-containing protein [Chromatiales bacterium]|jgi:adenylate cyclase|nr:adenylate/guanylate cyclase domain-containing protein [Chromatiales bacterium]
MTDYLGYIVPFGPSQDEATQDGVVGSWTTDAEGGFTKTHATILSRVQKRISLACKVRMREQSTRNVLATYLGPDAGDRVMAGQIRRGDGDRIHAVICYSDMRRSTSLAEMLSDEAFLEALNAYFECSAGAVIAHGGDVLRFVGDAVLGVGDAVLGIFPVRDGDTRRPAKLAVAAAHDAQTRLVRLNESRSVDGLEALDMGLGLHLGEVMFGNIGVPERLEFSVTGPAANLVARLEDLTKTLGRPVLLSGALASITDAKTEALGAFELRGVAEPVSVFALMG